MKFRYVYSFVILLGLPQLLYSQTRFSEAQTYFDKGNYTKVISILEPLTDGFSEDQSKSVELLGDAYSHTKDWDAAITQYKGLVDLYPEVANYHYKYGGALAMKALSVNKLMAIPLILEAKSECIEASELDANHIETRWALVKIYMELPTVLGGSTSKAIMYANQLESLSKVDGYLAKGYLYNKDEDFKQAEQFYKQAVAIGGSKTCYMALTEFYLNRDQKDKAIVVLEMGFERLKAEELQQKLEEITQ
ncbi:tetratricopeptide repeat protein [Formosa undariae]|uniref:Tetratricopeptide repeat protein n=1 Tax=Formosa undariae TaxID=1325436 RepID=A0ABV5F4X6_9FLAO